MKATVLYYSHTGRTAAYAREIAMYLWSKGLDVSLSSISDFDKQRLLKSDIVLSGCWTCGWFVIGQHPHRKWIDFSKSVAGYMDERKVMLQDKDRKYVPQDEKGYEYDRKGSKRFPEIEDSTFDRRRQN